MSKFFTNETQCLYLDQFAVSRICVSSPPAEWVDIALLIKKGVEQNRLIIPMPIEQMIETTGMNQASAELVDTESRKLSLGWCYFPEVDITAHYFICKIRNIQMTKEHFIHRKTQSYLDDPSVYEELGKLNLAFREMVEDGAKIVNIFRTAARGGPLGKRIREKHLLK